MNSLFTSVLEISWQAGLIALAVMAVRPLLRRAPRRAVCMLWLLVALRLLLPARLTVESPVSLQQPESPPIQAYQELRQQEKVYVSAPPEQRLEMAGPAAAQGFALLDQLPAIWLTGVGCMALYMALSLLRMRWRLRAAPRIQDNVYRCTDWSTPFVLGVLAPRIYVPETVSEQDFPQVLAHERCHIRRWDHVWKPLAFLLLAVNWFNPVLWAAYVLLGRDMERACDEMVLKNATPSQRAAYSRALVACAAQPKMAAVCPLAFGEVAVKERVKNVLNYKKPALWAVILLVVAAAIIGVCLLTKPAGKDAGVPDAETLYALRTEYIGDNAAVSGILDALGFRAAGAAGEGEAYTYSFEVETASEPYGVVVRYAFTDALPDWETVPLSYLCAYYLNGDGAYAEGAMDVLAQRYSQLPQQVRRYIRTLSGQADPRGNGDAAEALLRDISRYITSQLTGGLPVTVSYEKDQLSIAVTEVYSVVYRTVKYDENYSEDIPVYEVGSGAQLSVIKGEGFTLYGRYTSENRLLHDGEVIDLAQAYTGIGMDGLYNVQFRYIDRTEAARQDTLSFNDNGAGLVSYPAAWYSGSGYSICILADGWHRLTPMDGWNDATVDGSPVLNGKPVEVWESTEDIFARLYVAHLGAMTLKEAQDWAIGAAGSSFALIESKQGDMSGTDGTGNQDWTAAFRGSDTERFAVIKTYPVAQTEHLGYALNAMADTFTVQ